MNRVWLRDFLHGVEKGGGHRAVGRSPTLEIQKTLLRIAWVAQSVKYPTVDFGSGCDLTVMRSGPALASTLSTVCLSLCPLLLPPLLTPPLALTHALSQK